jgi:hypothetical protein
VRRGEGLFALVRRNSLAVITLSIELDLSFSVLELGSDYLISVLWFAALGCRKHFIMISFLRVSAPLSTFTRKHQLLDMLLNHSR